MQDGGRGSVPPPLPHGLGLGRPAPIEQQPCNLAASQAAVLPTLQILCTRPAKADTLRF